MTCLRCKLCAKPRRKSIDAFLTHGTGKTFAAMVATRANVARPVRDEAPSPEVPR